MSLAILLVSIASLALNLYALRRTTRKHTMDLTPLKSAVSSLDTAATAAEAALTKVPSPQDEADIAALAVQVQGIASKLSAAAAAAGAAPAPAPAG